MEEIKVDGVTYKKASVIAKEFGYTSDYIGQLCRARKVDAQLVGRSWYVSVAALSGHKNSRYRKNTLKTKDAIRREVIAAKEITLSLRQDAEHNTEKPNFMKSSREKDINYHDDDTELTPEPRRIKSVAVPVALHTEPKKTVLVDSEPKQKDLSIETSRTFKKIRGRLKIKSEEDAEKNLTEEIVEQVSGTVSKEPVETSVTKSNAELHKKGVESNDVRIFLTRRRFWGVVGITCLLMLVSVLLNVTVTYTETSISTDYSLLKKIP